MIGFAISMDVAFIVQYDKSAGVNNFFNPNK